jgi:O-antigen/teichoic acid export membrane protein
MSFFKKIINKHTISLATSAAMPLIGLLVMSLLAHHLTTTDFGNYIFFIITFSLADTFRTGFMQTSLVKFYSGASEARAQNMAGSAWYVGFILTSVLVLADALIYLFYKGADVNVLVTLKWFGIIYISTLPSALTQWILQAEQRFHKLFLIQVLNQGMFLLFISLMIVFYQISFTVAIYCYFSANLLTSITTILLGWSKLNHIRHKTREGMRELFNFGKYSVGTSVSSYLLRSSDSFIIKLMFRPEMVAIYYMPQRLMEIFEIPMRAGVATALPELSAAKHRNDEAAVAAIMKRYAGMLTVALVPVAIASFILGGLIFQLLFGQKYVHSDALNIFRIFMCYVMLMPIDRFFGITLDVINKPHLNMIKVFLMLAVNVVADFAGIMIFHNLYGVAIASIFTFITGSLFGYWQLKKYLKFTITDIFIVGYKQLKYTIDHLLSKKTNINQAP